MVQANFRDQVGGATLLSSIPEATMRFLYTAWLLAISTLWCPRCVAARDLTPVKPVMDCSGLAKVVLINPEAPGEIDTARVSSEGRYALLLR